MNDTAHHAADTPPLGESGVNSPQLNDASEQSVVPVRAHEQILLTGCDDAMYVESVTQRNWSRVGRARLGGNPVFFKQFVDRVGRGHPRGFRGDQATLATVGDEVAPGVQVVPVIGRNSERLVAVSPYIEMSTIDGIDRATHDDTERAGDIGRALRAVIEQHRDGDMTRVWKGIDPKNVGWNANGELFVFDFGPSKTMPVDVAASRVIAAGLLSRWVARPGLHLVWPETQFLHELCAPLVDLTSLDQVSRELDRHAELRRREPQRTGALAVATRFGLATLGRAHWASVRRSARLLFDD